MQKVVYVLLQQHAEKYWQMEHDDDDDVMADGEMRYRDVRLNCKYPFFSFQSVVHAIIFFLLTQ